jgi:hypothetical protein
MVEAAAGFAAGCCRCTIGVVLDDGPAPGVGLGIKAEDQNTRSELLMCHAY